MTDSLGAAEWPCQRGRLLTAEGRRWVASLSLSPAARSQVERLLRPIEAVEGELRARDRAAALRTGRPTLHRVANDLRRWADAGLCHLLAELGEAARLRRARQAVRAAGLDPVVDESGDTRRARSAAPRGRD